MDVPCIVLLVLAPIAYPYVGCSALASLRLMASKLEVNIHGLAESSKAMNLKSD